jgi:hypothetical protein
MISRSCKIVTNASDHRELRAKGSLPVRVDRHPERAAGKRHDLSPHRARLAADLSRILLALRVRIGR